MTNQCRYTCHDTLLQLRHIELKQTTKLVFKTIEDYFNINAGKNTLYFNIDCEPHWAIPFKGYSPNFVLTPLGQTVVYGEIRIK